MKVQLKLVKRVLLCSSILLILGGNAHLVSAESSSNDRGNLEFKIDRIEKGNETDKEIRETELEKVFPTLFTEEIESNIQAKQIEEEQSLEELEQSLFSMETESYETLEDIKQTLFTEEYSASASTTVQEQEDRKQSGWGTPIIAVFIGFALLLCGGVYVLMRKLLD
ncbi:type VII secretion protein EssA [Ornithinibacillus xuwenensis]|uniref:Type VII secretion protein EssA n=1 Tax=Ornithinibacillus xuwenensis TaxID=3144668 RepID=A0ABU9XL42_9BACI